MSRPCRASILSGVGALFLVLALPAAQAQPGLAAAAPAAPGFDPTVARDWHHGRQTELLNGSARLLAGFEPAAPAPRFAAPLEGRISSHFGYRNISVAGNRYHGGIDIAADTGTAVRASAAGTVSQAGWAGAYGYAVYIDHDDGSQSRYAHLSAMHVRVGQRVAQGEIIALSGNTGATTGPHLHFEIRLAGVAVDPLEHLELP